MNALERAIIYPAKVHPIARFVVLLVLSVYGVGWWIGRTQEQDEDAGSDVHAPRPGSIGQRSEMVRCSENGQQIWAADHNMTTAGPVHRDRDCFFSATYAAHLQLRR